jgi:hypothetical protein
MLVPLCCDCVPRRALQNVLRVRAAVHRVLVLAGSFARPPSVAVYGSLSLYHVLIAVLWQDVWFDCSLCWNQACPPNMLRSHFGSDYFVLELVSVDLDGLCRQEFVLSASRIPLNIWRDIAVIWTPLCFRFGSFVDSLRCVWSYCVSFGGS